MTIKIIQRITNFFTRNSENAMNNKKINQHIKQSLEQKPDEYIPGFADTEGMIVQRVKFYKEDLERISKLPVKEQVKELGKLKKQRRYTVEE